MLSNPPPSGLQARLRQHRRQNSTPTAFESMKIATNLPNMHPHQQQQQRPPHGRHRVSHRRGMSLDTRRQQVLHSPTFRQELHNMVSEHTTNTGHNTSQHVLREAQQQRIARPGQNQQAVYANLASDENYLMSPHTTPQMQVYEGQCFDGLSGPTQSINMSTFDMYNGQMSAMMKKNQESFADNMAASQDFELFPSSTMSTPTFMTFNESQSGTPAWMSEGDTSSRRSSRRISNGIMDRVAKFETLGVDESPRPLTPPQQNANDYFPLTPRDTPHDRTIKHSRRPQRFTDGYDESMEETVKPTQTSRRPKTTFDDMRQAAEIQPAMPTPRRPSTVPVPGPYDMSSTSSSFVDISQNDTMTIQTQFDGFAGPSQPLSAASTQPLSASTDFSHCTSPMTPHMSEFTTPFDMKSDLRPHSMALDGSSGDNSQSTEKPSRRGSPHHHHQHRRTESVASVASAASIASLDIEQTKTTTGVTLDDIHQFIAGPEPRDNKWVCKFEDCNKRFGRKENIKSHVQTHLNDRQYKCPTCNKCFVRQHDLKRHAKIHTGVKPYPCECGNSFARHDALTRHKQRGMCIGAFDGVVRKVVKRGRPRKHRPDMDERKEKSARTRRKNDGSSNHHKSSSSISSVSSSHSGYSDSSAVNSPDGLGPDDFDMLNDFMDVSMGGTASAINSSHTHHHHDDNVMIKGLTSSSAPMPSLGAARLSSSSAAELSDAAHSPSAASIHSYISQMSHMSLRHPDAAASGIIDIDLDLEGLSPQHLTHPSSPAKSVASLYAAEPPELSQSSSPPSSGPGGFFDSSRGLLGVSLSSSTASIPALVDEVNGGVGVAVDDDLLLQFTNGDANMLMLGPDSKFDEAFDPVGLYQDSTGDDVFFSGP